MGFWHNVKVFFTVDLEKVIDDIVNDVKNFDAKVKRIVSDAIKTYLPTVDKIADDIRSAIKRDIEDIHTRIDKVETFTEQEWKKIKQDILNEVQVVKKDVKEDVKKLESDIDGLKDHIESLTKNFDQILENKVKEFMNDNPAIAELVTLIEDTSKMLGSISEDEIAEKIKVIDSFICKMNKIISTFETIKQLQNKINK